jgi:hypothetical protein
MLNASDPLPTIKHCDLSRAAATNNCVGCVDTPDCPMRGHRQIMGLVGIAGCV